MLNLQDFLGEDDFYADILKDDIIKLDETSLSTTPVLPPVVGSQQETERIPQQETEGIPQQHVEALSLQADPFQGTANRRIKLRKQGPGLSRFGECSSKKIMYPESKSSPKCLLTTFSSMTIHHRLVTVAFGILTLVALFVYLLRGLWPFKTVTHGSLNKDFWH